MNIKQASEASGVSSRNIRYYEQAGLICPARDPGNGYRIYSEELVRTLKLIRILRMLDMPVEEIRGVLQGSLPLARAAEKQAERLGQQVPELETARKFCEELQQHQESVASLDTDACLRRMQEAPASHWYRDWVNDYRAVCRAEHRRIFTFTPDAPVTTPAGFTDALFGYAQAQDLNLVITREGMYPHFTIERHRIPRRALLCFCPRHSHRTDPLRMLRPGVCRSRCFLLAVAPDESAALCRTGTVHAGHRPAFSGPPRPAERVVGYRYPGESHSCRHQRSLVQRPLLLQR